MSALSRHQPEVKPQVTFADMLANAAFDKRGRTARLLLRLRAMVRCARPKSFSLSPLLHQQFLLFFSSSPLTLWRMKTIKKETGMRRVRICVNIKLSMAACLFAVAAILQILVR